MTQSCFTGDFENLLFTDYLFWRKGGKHMGIPSFLHVYMLQFDIKYLIFFVFFYSLCLIDFSFHSTCIFQICPQEEIIQFKIWLLFCILLSFTSPCTSWQHLRYDNKVTDLINYLLLENSINTCFYIGWHINTLIHTHMHTHTETHTHTHIYIYKYNLYVCVYVVGIKNTHAPIHTSPLTPTHIYIYMYIL